MHNDSQTVVESPQKPTWFVGASFGGTDDQLQRFLSDGIWENGYDEKLLDEVRSMRPGERIAIKSSYTRKHGLPFDGRNQAVSVLAIKATGTITENLGDGKRVRVVWEKVDPPREWYFYTYRGTVWRVMPGDWMNDALIAFAFEHAPQDLDRFRNSPFWRERYGITSEAEPRFPWTVFFEEVSEKLLKFANNRAPLIAAIHEIGKRVPKFQILQDKFPDGSIGPLQDICPFTAMGIFNRTMTIANRQIIATELAKFLGVSSPVPSSLDGIPVLNNQRSWYFGYADKRGSSDIDMLWNVFVTASKLVESGSSEDRDIFIQSYDQAIEVWGVAWNLSTGLYWAHPWDFPTLDSLSREYIRTRLAISIGPGGLSGPPDGQSYFKLIEDLRDRFAETACPVHSFPELSYASWIDEETESDENQIDTIGDVVLHSGSSAEEAEETISKPELPPYTINDILEDGCFLAREELEYLLDLLSTKKNLILQGPPGTGKTWLGRRLAYALMGEKNEGKIRVVQFHPNLSYEDFVRGWRPSGEGKLILTDGVFMEAMKAAIHDPLSKYVVVIEEINRGNPAQIFGELLTLLEASKRSPSEKLELCYPDADGKRRPVYIPPNLYVVGTMNVADRSLALVDVALRRRFAFVGLEPSLSPSWKRWVLDKCAVDPSLVGEIESRIVLINDQISADSRLGKQFRIGHSFVTPTHRLESGGTKQWFSRVVETEIGPLLEEYWFDDPEVSRKAIARLKQGW